MCYQRGLNFTTGYFKTILIVVYLLWTPCRTKNQNLPDGPSPAEVPKGLQRVKWVVGGMSFFRRAAAPVLMYFMDAMMQLPPTSFIPTFLHCLALLVFVCSAQELTTLQYKKSFGIIFQNPVEFLQSCLIIN